MNTSQEPRKPYIPSEATWSPYGYEPAHDLFEDTPPSDGKHTPAEANRRVLEVFSKDVESGDKDKTRAIIKVARRTRRYIMAGNDAGYVSMEEVSPTGDPTPNGTEPLNRKPKRDRARTFETIPFSAVPSTEGRVKPSRGSVRASQSRGGRG